MNIGLVRPFWPTAELVADVAAETPHQRIRQVVDRSYSKRYLELHDDLDDDERHRRMRHLRHLNATLATIGRAYAPNRTLVVVQKAVKEALPTVGMLPPSIELAHHNAVAGLARLRGLGVFSIWRPLPINGLAGKVCTTGNGWWLRGLRSAVEAAAAIRA
jgi:hypothetical protein